MFAGPWSREAGICESRSCGHGFFIEIIFTDLSLGLEEEAGLLLPIASQPIVAISQHAGRRPIPK